MVRPELRRVLDEVRANLKRLDACAGPHRFIRLDDDPLGKCRCELCGGELDYVKTLWYRKGQAHGQLLE